MCPRAKESVCREMKELNENLKSEEFALTNNRDTDRSVDSRRGAAVEKENDATPRHTAEEAGGRRVRRFSVVGSVVSLVQNLEKTRAQPEEEGSNSAKERKVRFR